VNLLVRYRHLESPHDTFVAELLSRLGSRQASPADTTPAEHLTEGETMVLRFLPTMHKASEIADDLDVSINTVKAHLRAVYRKLGVATRREAVERARAARLL
jgi:LuxR family maltose regulon positive regulatory protein